MIETVTSYEHARAILQEAITRTRREGGNPTLGFALERELVECIATALTETHRTAYEREMNGLWRTSDIGKSYGPKRSMPG